MGNYLDTRDLYKRQEELKSDLADLKDQLEEAEVMHTRLNEESAQALNDAQRELDEFENSSDGYELEELNNLENEVGREWMHGETLIPEEDFVEYVQDLADDIGANAGDASAWLVIDWEATANNVRQDYSEAEYQGTTYLFRAS